VNIAPPSAAVAHPDPKIVTVAASTSNLNAIRSGQTRSIRSTAPAWRYVVILSGA
jgi:hypothetical protein